MTDQPFDLSVPADGERHHVSVSHDAGKTTKHVDSRPVPRFEVVHKPRRRREEPEPAEVVRNPQPWHVRVIGGNGEPLMVSETYVDEESAYDVIVAVARMFELDATWGPNDDGDGGVIRFASPTGMGSDVEVPVLRVEVEA